MGGALKGQSGAGKRVNVEDEELPLQILKGQIWMP